MNIPGWFRRGAATAGVYLLVVLFVGGALTAVLALTTIPLTPVASRQSLGTVVGGGFLSGAMVQAPAAILCGIGLSLTSPRIRRKRGWLGWAIVGGVLVTNLSAMILFWPGDASVLSWVIGLVALSVPAGLSNVAAAYATLRLRPCPLLKPTADVFA